MNKILFWIICIAVFATAVFLLSSVLAPFLIACAVAYILQPVIDNVTLRYKIPRSVVAAVVFLIFCSVFVIVIVILLPVIYQQITIFISKIPAYKNYLQTELMPLITAKISTVEPSIANKIKDSISNLINGIFSLISGVANNIWRYTVATINVFIFIILIPIILFYFLRDWPKMVTNIKSLFPKKSVSKIQEILSAINNLLSAYIRGQLNICMLLSIFYCISLSVIGLDLGLLLGIISGFLIIIPFVGTLISFTITMIIGYFTFGVTSKLGYIVLVYLVGSIVEGYILTPKIIGDKIGLHPVWIIFAVLSCGSLFGFIGIFFAIPIAGIVKVLLLAAIECYRSSKFYKG